MATIPDESVQMATIAPVSLQTDVADANQNADRNHRGMTKEEDAAWRLETKSRRIERRLQGCQLRPSVLAQEGELDLSDVRRIAKQHMDIPWPKKPPLSPWHSQVRKARRLWVKTQKAEANLARPSTVSVPPGAPGRPADDCWDTTAAVEGIGPSTDNDHHLTNALPSPNTAQRIQPNKTQEAAKNAARDAEETSATSTDTTMKGGINEDKEGPEADNSVIGADMVRDERRGFPYPPSSYCMSVHTDRMFAEANATTSVSKPPESGITPQTASCGDLDLVLTGIEVAPGQNHKQTDLRFQFDRYSPYDFPQDAAVLPAQHEAIPETQTCEVNHQTKTKDTAVIGENSICKLEDVPAQSMDVSPATRSQGRLMSQEGEILEITSTAFLKALQAVREKKRKRSTSDVSDYAHRSLDERDEQIKPVMDSANSDLVRRRATISMLPCMYRTGRRGNQSAKPAGTVATDSPATESPFIGPLPIQRPSIRRRSISPRGTRGETRPEAFERAKAEGLIPSEMTYSDLLRLDEQDRLDSRRLSKVHKRAWEEAGRPPRPPGSTHNFSYSYVHDLINVPDVIRGPEAKRPKIQAKGEAASSTTRSGHVSDTRVQSLSNKQVVKKEQPVEASKPTSREVEVQDFIRQMSGRKSR
ncbi:hypothetical protein MBLNU457_1656t1 [Dothideomycetes sp. NU457]